MTLRQVHGTGRNRGHLSTLEKNILAAWKTLRRTEPPRQDTLYPTDLLTVVQYVPGAQLSELPPTLE